MKLATQAPKASAQPAVRPSHVEEHDLSRLHPAPPEFVDSLEIDPDMMDVSDAFDIDAYTGDRAMVQDGVLLSDQVHVVHHLNSTGAIHPLTDKVTTPETRALINELGLDLSRVEAKTGYWILNAEHALKRANGSFTGEVRDLIVYSSSEGDLNTGLVLSVFAQKLSQAGAEVYHAKDWSKFVVVRKDGSQLDGEELMLRVQPKEDKDHMRFFGSIHDTNSRRLATVLPAEAGYRVDRWDNRVVLKPMVGDEGNQMLFKLTPDSKNPHLAPQSIFKSLFGRFVRR